MRKLIWVGDAVVSSGFARATHKTLDAFVQSGRWDVKVIGINHYGDPHDYPYDIYPAIHWQSGGDPFGVRRTAQLTTAYRPDVIVVQQDPWNFAPYIKAAGNTPIIGAVAVDGKNCRGKELVGLKHAIFWTKFGQTEAQRGGYTGPSSVIPLGVDLKQYFEMDRAEARWRVGLPKELKDAFIVGNVNRNQPRKRLDLVITFFAEWIKSQKVRDAWLYLHVAPTGEDAYDCGQLAEYYGISNRVITTEAPLGYGVTEDQLNTIYNCFDCMFTCTQGEGMGLPHLEGMAAGIPQIVPRWSALADWPTEGSVQHVECSSIALTPGKINVIGGVADRVSSVLALDLMYRDGTYRESLAVNGLACAREDRFRWETVGKEFLKTVEAALDQTPLQISGLPEVVTT